MAKLIFKAPYYSPVSRTPEGKSRGGYAKYIATRDGVEIISRSGMAEYMDARQGSHGMFSDEGVPIDMQKICDEVDQVDGNVWGLIFSLKREDAERLGYNSAEQWMQLLRSRRNDIAKEMHIAPSHLRWYAAYHNKDKNPHVHMLVWSDRPREAYLDKTGIHNIKKTMAGDIFRQENYCVYKKQTEHRDHIRQSFRERMKEIVAEINDAAFNDPTLEEMLTKLAARMKTVKGKKQYGYLDRHTKAKVDAIVKRIAEDEKIQELYELWYQCQCEVYRTYTDAMLPKEPIEKNDVFKSLRNSVVKFALDITAIPDMAHYNGHYSYEPNAFRKTNVQKAKELLAKGKHDEAWTVLLDASRKGNSYAQAFIGDCLCRGRYWKQNKDMGMTYLGFAAEKNNSYAMFRLGIEYLESDPEEAEYWFKEAAELDNSFAKYSLYRLYKNGIVKPELSSDTYSYLRQAAETGMDVAEYEYSKYLKDKNPELSREYLKRSAERGFSAAMYAYGKLLLEEGKEQEALSWLERAAERDTWARTQLGLLYLYRFNNFEKFKEHIESAANEGDSYAKAAIKHYNSNRNYQLVMGIANLFYYASRIFEDDAAEQDEQMKLGEIDSKLKREIRQKREAQGLHW